MNSANRPVFYFAAVPYTVKTPTLYPVQTSVAFTEAEARAQLPETIINNYCLAWREPLVNFVNRVEPFNLMNFALVQKDQEIELYQLRSENIEKQLDGVYQAMGMLDQKLGKGLSTVQASAVLQMIADEHFSGSRRQTLKRYADLLEGDKMKKIQSNSLA